MQVYSSISLTEMGGVFKNSLVSDEQTFGHNGQVSCVYMNLINTAAELPPATRDKFG